MYSNWGTPHHFDKVSSASDREGQLAPTGALLPKLLQDSFKIKCEVVSYIPCSPIFLKNVTTSTWEEGLQAKGPTASVKGLMPINGKS